ncbi:MAG: restriction endonuclease [Fimbriimonadaceae bacterium]|nr:restriction endonuclease [Fimbriimonadaceae bacterium]
MHIFALKKAIVDAICACFWFHNELREFMLSCGVPENYYDAQVKQHANKRAYINTVLTDLENRGKPGLNIIDRIAIELCTFQGDVYAEKLDPAVAKDKLSVLRKVAVERGLIHPAGASSKWIAPIKSESKEAEIESLRGQFDLLYRWKGTSQERGIEFQKFLGNMFRAYGLEYHPPFRTTGQEIDGMFIFGDRRYLIEAKWEKTEANFEALSHFHSKCSTKFTGTVGLFVSMEGFSDEALAALDKLGESRFILLSGIALMKIIDRTVSLPDALHLMINDAHKRGVEVVTF